MHSLLTIDQHDYTRSPPAYIHTARPLVKPLATTDNDILWWSFLVGLGSATYFNAGLYLAFGELVVALTFIMVVAKRSRLLSKPPLTYYFPLALLMFASTLLSELVNRAELYQLIRGIPRAASFITLFITLTVVILSNPRAILSYLKGSAISYTVAIYYFRSGWLSYKTALHGEEFGLQWKTTYGAAASAWVLLTSLYFYRKRPLLTVFLLAATSATHLAFGSRSAALFTAIGAAFGLWNVAKRFSTGSIKKPRITYALTYACLGMIVVVLAATAYQFAATEGYLSEAEQKKYEAQSTHKYGMLVAARGSVLTTILAIIDRPILGHGAWAKDTGNYTERAHKILGFGAGRSSRISFHSLLFGDWMQWGFVYAVFWASILIAAARLMLLHIQTAGPYTAFLAVLAPSLMWDVLFSPLGDRVDTAFSVAIVVAAPYLLKQSPKHAEAISNIKPILPASPHPANLTIRPTERT